MELDIQSKKDKLLEFVKTRGGGAEGDIEIHESDIAEVILTLHEENREDYDRVIKALPPDMLGLVALELPEKIQEELARDLSAEEWAAAVNELETDDATDIMQKIEEVDEAKAYEIMRKVNTVHKEIIEHLKRFDDNTAGAIMQTELFSAKLDETIGEAIKRLKTLVTAGELTNIHFVFLVDDRNRLKAMLSLEELIMLDLDKNFADSIADFDEPIFVYGDDPIETVTQTVERYDLAAIAVVDNFGHLLGRITSDDIYDMIEDRATEQIYSLAQVGEEIEHEEGAVKGAVSRAKWLLLNLFSAAFAATVVNFFSEAIEQVVALAALMPIVASMGGVSGTQTLTVTVRKLALGDIKIDNARPIIVREITIGLLNGAAFAAIVGICAAVWFKMPLLGLVAALALVANMTYAAFFGSCIPLVLKKLNIDPAAASATLLTTVTDVAGFFTFLSIATLILF